MLVTLLSVFVFSFVLTGMVRQYALKHNILDIPNFRSSHSVTTPRGGGVAFVVVFLSVLPILAWGHLISLPNLFTLIAVGAVVAGLGYFDDHGHIPAKWRLVGQSLASFVTLYMLGGMPAFELFSVVLAPGITINVLAFIFLVWLINLYNFMDGIHGIASIEAISVCLAMAFIYWLTNHAQMMILPILLGAAVFGFVFWNFPVPKIFMGDAGSGFLGAILGFMMIQGGAVSSSYFYCWLILLGVFIVDASITLLNRLWRGDRIYEAHRSHAYQHAALQLKSHTPVTFSVLGINLLWLLPISVFVALGYLNGTIGLVLAYLPLMLVSIKLKAGREV